MSDLVALSMVVMTGAAFIGILAGKRLKRNRKEGI